MKNLFERATVDETIARLERMSAASERQWGKMNPAQALAHCSLNDGGGGRGLAAEADADWTCAGAGLQGYGPNDKQMGKNSPTDPAIVVSDERDFESERERLEGLIRRFQAGGPNGCTGHPHSFFGRLTPDEWASLQWKHVDHHLRQFCA